VDRALKIQDWLSSQENHDLLAYGVEGTDWEAVGDDKYKALSDYSFPGFSILWRLDLERKADTISESEEEIFEWSKVYDNFTIDPLATFYPDVAPVEAEEAELTNVVTEYIKPIAAGTVDVDKGLDKVKKAAEKAGIEKVMEEMKSQISEYLKTQG
jgi:putative aldouronate transport system substrate-binding protein